MNEKCSTFDIRISRFPATRLTTRFTTMAVRSMNGDGGMVQFYNNVIIRWFDESVDRSYATSMPYALLDMQFTFDCCRLTRIYNE